MADVASRLATGRLRVFSTCGRWLKEYRRYRRDEKDELVEEGDYMMRATALIVVHGLALAVTENQAVSDEEGLDERVLRRQTNMTGY